MIRSEPKLNLKQKLDIPEYRHKLRQASSSLRRKYKLRDADLRRKIKRWNNRHPYQQIEINI